VPQYDTGDAFESLEPHAHSLRGGGHHCADRGGSSWRLADTLMRHASGTLALPVCALTRRMTSPSLRRGLVPRSSSRLPSARRGLGAMRLTA
jgi:hypothetical protein